MDGQDYLNQISASVRPEKQSKSNFLSSPIFKVTVGGVLALALILIIGSVLTSGNTGIQPKIISLKYHIDNTLEVISDYQPSVKSSILRSNSASLYSLLSNTSRELNDYISETYNSKDNSDSNKNLASKAALSKDELDATLFDAKINGILDKIYANKMSYEISSIMSEESNIYNATNSENLESILNTSYTSLGTLLPNFDSFSTK